MDTMKFTANHYADLAKDLLSDFKINHSWVNTDNEAFGFELNIMGMFCRLRFSLEKSSTGKDTFRVIFCDHEDIPSVSVVGTNFVLTLDKAYRDFISALYNHYTTKLQELNRAPTPKMFSLRSIFLEEAAEFPQFQWTFPAYAVGNLTFKGQTKTLAVSGSLSFAPKLDTNSESKWIYQVQSGTLNEGFRDIRSISAETLREALGKSLTGTKARLKIRTETLYGIMNEELKDY